MKSGYAISIGVCAYNEEKNIDNFLKRISEQYEHNFKIVEIIIVSESIDNTDKIINTWMKKNNKIKLINDKERTGKACAVNKFIIASKGDILVLIDADVVPETDVIRKLVESFDDPKVGMTGGKRIPIVKENSFIGFVEERLWKAHDYISSNGSEKKLGMPIAFRKKFIKAIPSDISADEACIQFQIQKNGLKTLYIQDAIIHHKGPENINDFIKQRRRIASAHLDLNTRFGYTVATNRSYILLKTLPFLFPSNPRHYIWFFGAIFLEIYCRFLGFYDLKIKRKRPFKWEMAESTKDIEICEI